ncbi:MAG: glyoxylate/hydroxypyruvate reductase A [Alphaproteobacteria bacterium]
MALLFASSYGDPEVWGAMLRRHMPDLDLRVWPDTGAVEDIEAALVWRPKRGEMRRFPNLKFICSLGMGVDHIFRDPDLPEGVPICRVVDPDLIARMSEYIVLEVLRRHRRADEYDRLQGEHVWRRTTRSPVTGETRVGFLGLGEIGRDAAEYLVRFGFDVAGWSRSKKDLAGIESFHGKAGLGPLLARSNILICLLPLTPATEGIIDAGLLAGLPEGAYVINVARGGHVVDADLIAALDSGRLAGATLDVFHTEPLPADHPFWAHKKIRVTPHNAGHPNPDNAAGQVIENLRRVRKGLDVLNRVDPKAGY